MNIPGLLIKIIQPAISYPDCPIGYLTGQERKSKN